MFVKHLTISIFPKRRYDADLLLTQGLLLNHFEHPEIKDIALTEVLAALGDPVRLELVGILARNKGEVGWGEFSFGINKATLSYHVKILRLAGIIQHRKEGTRCFVSLRKDLDDAYPGLLVAILKAQPAKH